MVAEVERVRGAASVNCETPQSPGRPATVNLIAAVSTLVECLDDPFRRKVFNEVLDQATSFKDLDVGLEVRLGPKAVWEVKRTVIELADAGDLVFNAFPQKVREKALRWANRGLEEFEQKAREQERVERQTQTVLAKIVHIESHQPWSRRRKSEEPRGPGRHAKKARTTEELLH